MSFSERNAACFGYRTAAWGNSGAAIPDGLGSMAGSGAEQSDAPDRPFLVQDWHGGSDGRECPAYALDHRLG